MTRKKTGGRNCYGRVTARGIGGGHKQKLRLVDFKREQARRGSHGRRPSNMIRFARPGWRLLQYKDGEKRYIIAPVGVKVGSKLMSGPTAPPEVG